jgi:hypothetical protein
MKGRDERTRGMEICMADAFAKIKPTLNPRTGFYSISLSWSLSLTQLCNAAISQEEEERQSKTEHALSDSLRERERENAFVFVFLLCLTVSRFLHYLVSPSLLLRRKVF